MESTELDNLTNVLAVMLGVSIGLRAAVVVSVATSVVALFALGSWTGKISGAVWWRDGLRLLLVASVAAFAAAAVGTTLRVD